VVHPHPLEAHWIDQQQEAEGGVVVVVVVGGCGLTAWLNVGRGEGGGGCKYDVVPDG